MQTLPKLETSWNKILKEELNKTYFQDIQQKITDNINAGITIYPPSEKIFNAFEKTPFNKLKVVILGQDPYHGPGQAQGFCFSVPNGMKLPPSLKNIYKELNGSLGIDISENGDLTPWTEQGVFLLNASLTVQASKPMSHANIGWEIFTDSIIKTISDKKEGIIFLLWGAFAQSKEKLIDTKKHIVLKTTHPSPFSAYRGFLGSGCFKEVNEILKEKGEKEIDWKID